MSEQGDKRQFAQGLIETGTKAALDRSIPANIQQAYKLFVSACYADPTFDGGFYAVGNANSDMSLLSGAVATYRRALECEQIPANRARTLTNLGWRLHGLGQTQEALAVTQEALQLDPDITIAYINLSCIYGTLMQHDQAIEAARKAFELEPQTPVTEMTLAFALLFAGRFAEGLSHFERRFEYKLHSFLNYPYPKWNGEAQRTIFLVADQGIGDTLSFARFVEAACKRSKYVHACIQPSMMKLFTHAFRRIPNLNLLPSPCNIPVADHWTTFVSLPYALCLTDKEIIGAPGIELDATPAISGWKITERKLHIGIAWSGSPLNEINEQRSIPLRHFAELYRVPGIQLYSFQVDDRKKELHEQGYSGVIADMSGYIQDIGDTIALLQHMDLVITCESAMGHIAGAANKECWVPYSWLGRDYRASADGKSPIWYPKHRFFQQGPDARWEPVFEMIINELRARV